MTEPKDSNLLRLWAGFFIQSIIFVVVMVLAMIYFIKTSTVAPEWGKYSLIAAGLSFLPSLPVLRSYRGLFATSRGPLDDARRAAIRRQMLIGLMVADLPAIAGVVHYVLSGELMVMLGFCVVTCVIVYLYRPPQA